ncbi:anti-sigma B factor antagonist [Candidatus Magnetomoraceae bacterium gMMP-15]
MRVKTTQKKEATIVDVSGRIDGITAPDFQRNLNEVSNEHSKIVIINMNELEYISSVGFRVIIATSKKLKAANSDILLAGLQGNVKKAFVMARFDLLFNIFDTKNAALEYVAANATA